MGVRRRLGQVRSGRLGVKSGLLLAEVQDYESHKVALATSDSHFESSSVKLESSYYARIIELTAAPATNVTEVLDH